MAFKDLFRPDYKHSDNKVRYEAIRKLGIEGGQDKLLGEIAKTDEDLTNRFLAVNFLDNQEILADIATNGDKRLLCLDALDKITDKTLLADIAKNAKDSTIRYKALKKSRQA